MIIEIIHFFSSYLFGILSKDAVDPGAKVLVFLIFYKTCYLIAPDIGPRSPTNQLAVVRS